MKVDNSWVRIDNSKVYTSAYRYATKVFPKHRLVGISIGVPDYFEGDTYRKLNPTKELLMEYKYGNMTKEEYTEIYIREVLSKLDAKEIYNKFRGRVLLCYCEPGDFCHRNIVVKWLNNELGQVVAEEVKYNNR